MDENLKIVLGLAKKSDGELEDFCFSVIDALTDNEYFPQPTTPTLDELTAGTEAFKDALAAAASRDKTAVVLKNQKRKALEVTIRAMAAYVELSQDEAKITSAGFKVASTSRSARTLGDANGITIKPGNTPGTVICEVGKVDFALTYFVEYAPNPMAGNMRIHVPAEKRKCVIANLKSLAAYDFIGGAAGANGVNVYTETVTKTVL